LGGSSPVADLALQLNTASFPSATVTSFTSPWGSQIGLAEHRQLQSFTPRSVSNDLLPFVVGQSYDSFTLLSIKGVMFSALSAGHSSVVH
jgi:hypothetical protein